MKTVSISEAREQFSSVISWAEKNKDDVVVENRGKAKAVIIPFVDYELLQEARERKRKEKAIAQLQKIAQEVRANNPDMTAEEADKIGEEVTRDAIESLVAKGKVKFK